jgi:uncharacterized protein
MQFHQDTNSAKFQIKSYRPGQLIVNGESYEQPILIASHHLSLWTPSLQTLSSLDWQPVLALQPKIVLIGTGEDTVWLQPALLQPLIDRQIGYELMNTGAACRTFTILTADERRVCAVLYP